MLAVNTKVKVIRDAEDPESGWVGAVGTVWERKYEASVEVVVVKISEGNPNPDDGPFAWFSPDELEAVEQ
jgi:hypothetical protein